ncbi:ABC transporter substrate-binding protein [Pseudochelatococcus contaminans]|uniref:Peptide/nickel transport system substrate-binding protein n=1 Tax=Pseudochelatococcus contaminans TaxID=1538103 RepID=A0A7W5Z6L1_9HYPH|nr:ABC transporter substrate-binding protein [Pseudochelatococcus contaminans]MBB3810436.1 peptide/nickel transport system substrate-binding protein [Pseudochelatococcus contaminans]
MSLNKLRSFFGRSLPVVALGLAATMQVAAAETPSAGGELIFGVTTEPVCFNPHRSTQQNAYILIRNYIDSLVGKVEGGKFVPWLATEWSISPDGKEYIFKLRDDVTFHDGSKFDAEAVKFNIDFVKNAENTNSSGDLLRAVESVEAVSPTEVRIRLTKPDSALLESIASIRLGIISPKSLQAGNGLCAGGRELAGTGPFIFDNYTRGQSVTFVKNENYNWGPDYAKHEGPAYLDKVTVSFLPEYAVRAGALSSGQVDVIEGVQPTDIGLFKDQPGFQFLTGPSGAQTSFTLNINYTIPPATDVRVRRALRDGADIDALVKSVYLGAYPRAFSNIGRDGFFYNKALEGAWGNNVAEANRILDEAGWTGRDAEGFRTKDGERLSIEVGYPQPYVRDNRDVLIQGLQAELRKNLGFDLKLRFISGGEWAQALQAGSWTIYPNTYLPADAAQMLQGNIGELGFIRAVADKGDKELFRLINEALASTDPDEKKKLVDEAQRYAVDQAIIVPLFSANYQLAAKDKVRGLSFETQLDSPSNFYDVWLAKD